MASREDRGTPVRDRLLMQRVWLDAEGFAQFEWAVLVEFLRSHGLGKYIDQTLYMFVAEATGAQKLGPTRINGKQIRTWQVSLERLDLQHLLDERRPDDGGGSPL